MAGVILLVVAPSHAQAPDLFQSAPGPEAPKPKSPTRASQPPEPAAIRPSRAPSAIAGNYEGTWAGNYTCGLTTNGLPGFVHRMQATVSTNQMELNWGTPGTIGSQHSTGALEANGSVKLVGEGISDIPGTFYGIHYAIALSGQFEGERFGGHGLHGGRSCELVLTRAGR